MRTYVQVIVCAIVVAFAATAWSQPQPPDRDHRDHRDRDRDRDRPREAPPAARVESVKPRAGFVWIAGRWDWKGGKWAWTAGHWERERAGKRWRDGRWDRKGDTWEFVAGEWIAADPNPTPNQTDDRPRQPPPALRDEKIETRPGYVFVRGRWEWRAGKWEWIAGHWERERAGKRWREGRWEKRDDRYVFVDGDWIDAGAPQPPQPTPQRPQPRPREWKLDRPVVSSYWPVKGKVGSRIVIRGRNFPADTSVLWGGQLVAGAKVQPEQIVVVVPSGATDGVIALRLGRARPLAVGSFEVVDGFDPVAAQRAAEQARRERAEAAWRERQKQLAKNRAAREAAWRQRADERAANRDARRAERAEAIRRKWAVDFLADEETQLELTLHARRVAELERMRDVAEVMGNGKLVVRVDVARSREDERHDQRMAALRDAFGGR